MNNLPRGLRNHNPLNIRRKTPAEPWKGLSPKQTDKSFCQFINDDYGYRAAFCTLRTYHDRGIDTVRKIINTWAPPSENYTSTYIRRVCEISGIGADEKIKLKDEPTMVALVCAMAMVENGVTEVDVPSVKRGFGMAFRTQNK